MTKKNYEKHILRHKEIQGEEGREEIEETLLNPTVITEYRRDPNGENLSCEAYFRIIGKRKIGKGKLELEFWEVNLVRNKRMKRWDVATAFPNSAPKYAMINNKIHTIIRDARKKDEK